VAVRLTLRVEPQDDEARELLEGELTPACAARLVGPTAPNGILMRLFDDSLAGESFPEAPSVIWYCHWHTDGDAAVAILEGSEHWFGDAEPGPTVDVRAWPDAELDDDD